MEITNLVELVKAECARDVPEEMVKSWCELGRLKVLSARGKWSWMRLLQQTTINMVVGTTDYTSPFQTSDPLIRKLLVVERQAETDEPIDLYNPEAFHATQFVNPLEGATIISVPDNGVITLRFGLGPDTAESLDCWYQRQSDVSDLSFVSEEDHEVFYWAALTFAYAKLPQGGIDQTAAYDRAVAAFRETLDSAILNDYIAATEIRKLAPPKLMSQLTATFDQIRGKR